MKHYLQNCRAYASAEKIADANISADKIGR
jgi:hypothetical protein